MTGADLRQAPVKLMPTVTWFRLGLKTGMPAFDRLGPQLESRKSPDVNFIVAVFGYWPVVLKNSVFETEKVIFASLRRSIILITEDDCKQ